MRSSLALSLLLLATPAWSQWTSESLSVPRGGIGAASAGRYALFAGGFDFTDTFDVVDVYDAQERSWSTTQLSIPRGLLAATSDGTTALFAGGFTTLPTGNQTSSRVDLFDSTTGTWSVAELSAPRSNMGAAAGAGLALFAGGGTVVPSNVIDLYEFSTGTWSASTLSIPRSQPSVTWFDGRFWIMGGQFGSATIDIYDPLTGLSSTELLPQAHEYTRTCVAGDWLVVLAGSGHSDDTVYLREAGTSGWSQITLPFARSAMAMIGVGPLAYFCGGEVLPIPTDRVDVYDTRTSEWSQQTLPQNQRNAAGLVHYGRMMVAGGALGQAFEDHVAVLEPSVGQSYCFPNAINSTGFSGRVDAFGQPFASGGALSLVASDLPPGEFTLFLASFTQGGVPGPSNPSVLCVTTDIGRFSAQVGQVSPAGILSATVDTGALPQGTGPVSILPGQTVYFQAWHRNGLSWPLFTGATAVTFQ